MFLFRGPHSMMFQDLLYVSLKRSTLYHLLIRHIILKKVTYGSVFLQEKLFLYLFSF